MSNMIDEKMLGGLAEAIRISEKQLDVIRRSSLMVQNLVSVFPLEDIKRIVEQQERFLKAVQQSRIPDFAKMLAETQEPFIRMAQEAAETHRRWQETNERVKEVNQVLLGLGWWIYPDWTIPSLRGIIEAHAEGRDGEIEQEIIQFFDDEKLDEIIGRWESNQKLTRIIVILKDAVEAHKQEKYTLSIPALVPQVEGIINENSGRSQWANSKECITILKEFLNKKFPHGTLSLIYPLALVKFMDSLYGEKFQKGTPSNKGRHPILHGHHVDYPNKAYSLKLILLIDYIQNLI